MYKIIKRDTVLDTLHIFSDVAKLDTYDICDASAIDKLINYKTKNLTYMAYVFYFTTASGALRKVSHLQSNINGLNISGDNILPITINLINKTITIKKELNYKLNNVTGFDIDMYKYTIKKININTGTFFTNLYKFFNKL